MNFDGNFLEIGKIDPEPLRELVTTISDEEWNSDPFRQKRYEVHRDTQSVPLVFDPDFRHSHPTRLPRLQDFEQALIPALGLVADHYEESDIGHALIEEFGLGYFVRATLVRLVAGGSIAPHTDNNFSLVHSHRVHVPIETNPGVEFTVGEETRSLAAGHVYEINNRRMHAVANTGDVDRVHLILDFVLPGEQCCCGRKLHPTTLCSPQACRDTDHLQIACTCYPVS